MKLLLLDKTDIALSHVKAPFQENLGLATDIIFCYEKWLHMNVMYLV